MSFFSWTKNCKNYNTVSYTFKFHRRTFEISTCSQNVPESIWHERSKWISACVNVLTAVLPVRSPLLLHPKILTGHEAAVPARLPRRPVAHRWQVTGRTPHECGQTCSGERMLKSNWESIVSNQKYKYQKTQELVKRNHAAKDAGSSWPFRHWTAPKTGNRLLVTSRF